MPRKDGPSAWVYRWRETNEHGERQLRKKVIGTVKQYPTKALASSAIETLKLSVNRQGFQKLAGTHRALPPEGASERQSRAQDQEDEEDL